MSIENLDKCLSLKLSGDKVMVTITPASVLNIPNSQRKPLTRDEIMQYITAVGYRNYFLYDDVIDQISHDFLHSNTVIEKVVGEKRDCVVTVDVSEDRMRAYLTVAAARGGKDVNETMIRKALEKAGVKYGIKNEVIEQALIDLYLPKTIVAEGIPPINGKDSTFEYLIEETKKGPKELEDGSVDYKELGIVTSVEVGTPLMRRHPPTPGEPGKNVFGEEIPPIPGKDKPFGHGKGSTISPEDDNLLIATVSGEPKPGPNYVKVNPVFQVKEVNFKTGNINFAGSVYVSGNVTTGFKINAGEDVEVEGVVEASDIIANGDIRLKSGVVGNNKAIIKARGNIHAKFIESATVEAEGDIIISDQLMHSKTTAGGSVIVGDSIGRGQIVGGITRATNLIKAKNLGSPASTTTSLIVGIDPYIQNKIKKIREDLSKNKKELEETIKSIIYLRTKGITKKKIGQILIEKGIIKPEDLEQGLKEQSGGNSKKIGEILVDLGFTTIEEVEQALNEQLKDSKIEELTRLEEKREMLLSNVNMLSEDEVNLLEHISGAESAKIIGLDKIYAGVKISISEHNKLINEDSPGGTYYITKDGITLGPVMKSDRFY